MEIQLWTSNKIQKQNQYVNFLVKQNSTIQKKIILILNNLSSHQTNTTHKSTTKHEIKLTPPPKSNEQQKLISQKPINKIQIIQKNNPQQISNILNTTQLHKKELKSLPTRKKYKLKTSSSHNINKG